MESNSKPSPVSTRASGSLPRLIKSVSFHSLVLGYCRNLFVEDLSGLKARLS